MKGPSMVFQVKGLLDNMASNGVTISAKIAAEDYEGACTDIGTWIPVFSEILLAVLSALAALI